MIDSTKVKLVKVGSITVGMHFIPEKEKLEKQFEEVD